MKTFREYMTEAKLAPVLAHISKIYKKEGYKVKNSYGSLGKVDPKIAEKLIMATSNTFNWKEDTKRKDEFGSVYYGEFDGAKVSASIGIFKKSVSIGFDEE